MDVFRGSCLLLAWSSLLISTGKATPPEPNAGKLTLHEGWAIQSSVDVRETGAAISAPGFKAREWYPATVPSTVLGTLVQDRIYPDPCCGMNLRSIPGTYYPILSPDPR